MAKDIRLLWAYLAIGTIGFVFSLFGVRGRYLTGATRPAAQYAALTGGMDQDSSADGRFEIETLDDRTFVTPAKETRFDSAWFQSGEWTPPVALVVRRITFFGEGPAGLTRYVFDYDPHQPLKADQDVRVCCSWVRKNDGDWEYEGPLLTAVARRDAFYRLIDADDLEGCQLHVQGGADPCQLGSHGQTWLHYAAMKGRLAITCWLIDCGVSVNAATVGGHGDLIGETALHAAARYGHLEVVETLLVAKAEVNATCHVMRGGSRVNSALDLAKLGGHAEVAALLSEAGGLESSQWS